MRATFIFCTGQVERSQRYTHPLSSVVMCLTFLTLTYQIKYYLEGSGRDRQAVHDLLGRVVNDLAAVWMNATENGLGRP